MDRIFADMDVSIAVSLIRGQMGTVVERAVNVAVETVLAEMLKVVGAKFEELKTQVMLMKRDMVALQKEKVLKEKENDNIRAKLRYTELKLKYYRQGVEEELQQRASSSTLVRIYPTGFAQVQGGEVLPSEPSPSCSAQRTPDTVLVKSSQGETLSDGDLLGLPVKQLTPSCVYAPRMQFFTEHMQACEQSVLPVRCNMLGLDGIAAEHSCRTTGQQRRYSPRELINKAKTLKDFQ